MRNPNKIQPNPMVPSRFASASSKTTMFLSDKFNIQKWPIKQTDTKTLDTIHSAQLWHKHFRAETVPKKNLIDEVIN